MNHPLRPDQRLGLPAWTYHSHALTELEKKAVFATHWQIAGHVSDLPNPGDWLAFDFADERALVLRDEGGTLRAFHNICRHRGARVVAEAGGNCPGALVCPFHGWVYNLDGSLRGPARPGSFGPMERKDFGLIPIEMEVWHGFIFLRARPGPQPAVAALMAPLDPEIAPLRLDSLEPTDEGEELSDIPVNWKSVQDVDNEGYHVAMAHPALQDLYGAAYRDEPLPNGLSRSLAPFNAHRGRRWSVRQYRALIEPAPHLPEAARNRWAYFGLFPTNALEVTPERVLLYQSYPLTARSTLLRGRTYRFPGETRRRRVARYLVGRIGAQTSQEDIRLSIWSDEAMRSSAFPGFHLSDLEAGVRAFHDGLRTVLPVVAQPAHPGEDRLTDMVAAVLVRG